MTRVRKPDSRKDTNMTYKERALAALNHTKPDRGPIQDGPWATTIRRWRREGMPDYLDASDYFGFDKWTTLGADNSPRFPSKTLEETEDYTIYTTSSGGVRKSFKNQESTPEIIDWAIKTKDDWYKKIKPRLEPDFTRMDWASMLAQYQTAREEGRLLVLGGVHGYDLVQSYMKSDSLLMAMAEDPAWVREMFTTHVELMIESAKLMIEKGIRFDVLFTCNDMGYRNSSLFSPKTYRDVVFEGDQMLFGFCHDQGMKTMLHSCGCVKELIPGLIEAGLDCLQPLEVKAGMDIVELKEKYGDELAFMGGIDVRAMADPDPSKIEEEIARKFEVAMKDGAYIYHSDHSVPDNVSFQQYQRVMQLVKEHGEY